MKQATFHILRSPDEAPSTAPQPPADGGATPTPAPAGSTPSAGLLGEAPEPTPTASWRDNLPEELRDVPSLQKFKDLSGLAKSYVEAEKKIGQPQLPKPDENWTEQQWSEVYKALGRPDTPDAYEINPPEGIEFDENLVRGARETFHKAGLTPKQVQEVMGYYTQTLARDQEARQQQIEELKTQSQASLELEWGESFASNIAVANQVLKRFGSPEIVSLLSTTGLANHADVVKLFYKIGQQFMESGGPGQHPTSGFMGGDVADARAAIERMNSDKSFQEALNTRSHPNHQSAVQQWEAAHKAAYPGTR